MTLYLFRKVTRKETPTTVAAAAARRPKLPPLPARMLSALALLALTGAAVCEQASPPDTGYTGSEVCANCHPAQFLLWRGSHHDLAMQHATADTVLGNFSGTSFTQHGVTTRFFKRDGRFYVNTEDQSGTLKDFEIRFTFGVDPLQQYLIEFPNGALQTLGVAWDTRPTKHGGQRWFHVYGEEKIPHDDELHWTTRTQTWNYQCADCHSLNVRKNYAADTDAYATTWDVIDVGCEGCHGPGGEHVRLAPGFDPQIPNKGLTHSLTDRSGGRWVRADDAPVARRTAAPDSNIEINTCARCHSRRTRLRERPYTGQAFLDDYRPALLTPQLYHLDGQIKDEVYVYGSFLQSRMHQAGVVCSDCHDPHSGRTLAQGNELCTRCHAPGIYDVPAHHHHAGKPGGAQCVECHMPAKNYMVIDSRRDHSLRVPRPDLSLRLGVPNACSNCHHDQSQQWAADHIADWRGADTTPGRDFAELLALARQPGPGALAAALTLVNDENAPAIIRATAARELGGHAPRDTLQTLAAASTADDGLLRLGAIDAVGGSVVPLKLQVALPNAYDDLLSVRVAAARALATVAADQIPAQTRDMVSRATDEYIATETLQSDHPGALGNLGAFFADQGKFEQATAAYERALVLTPDDIRATLGLADVYRATGRDDAGEKLLTAALAKHADAGELHHALGLLLVRQKNADGALEHLARAATLAPHVHRYHYVLAIARRSYGQSAEALAGLEASAYRFPNDIPIMLLLAELHHENGNPEQAIAYAEQLAKLVPDDPRAMEFLRGLTNAPR